MYILIAVDGMGLWIKPADPIYPYGGYDGLIS